MSGRTWVYADPHFYHKNIVKFGKYNGDKLRPLWDDAEQMTEEMIEWYNELVNDTDRVYILGDVAFSSAHMHGAVSRLKGRKCLVPGNHEPTKMRKYFGLFDDVRGYVQRDKFIMSHIPLHPHCLGRWSLNIHGHLHSDQIMESGCKQWIEKVPRSIGNIRWEEEVFRADYSPVPDLRYYCASVERTNFRPKLLDEILHERGLK